jgi:hypothetical protein
VKKYLEEQKHFTQRRKAAKDAKKAKQLFIGNLCALASLREIVYFFTASGVWAGHCLVQSEISRARSPLIHLALHQPFASGSGQHHTHGADEVS